MWANWLLKELMFKEGLLKYSAVSQLTLFFPGWSLVLQVCVGVAADQWGRGREWGQWQQTGFQWWQPLQTQQWHCRCESGTAPGLGFPPSCIWLSLADAVSVGLGNTGQYWNRLLSAHQNLFPVKTWCVGLGLETGREIDFGVLFGINARVGLSWH